jgi:hypothetical protein
MMANVVIKCPTTDKLVPTGIAMDAQSFQRAEMGTNTLGNCPACGGNHVWNKEDAQLEE